jgi:hypothetical protein
VPPIINQIFSGAGTASSDGYSISIKRVQPAAGSLLISNTSGLMCGLVPVVATALADGALECEQIDTEEPRLFPAGVDLATHFWAPTGAGCFLLIYTVLPWQADPTGNPPSVKAIRPSD